MNLWSENFVQFDQLFIRSNFQKDSTNPSSISFSEFALPNFLLGLVELKY